MKTHAGEVPGSVCLRAERVQRRRHALEDGEADDVHGGRANARGREVIGAQMAGHDGRDDGEGVLQQICCDQGQ